jgi:hypothetical protein
MISTILRWVDLKREKILCTWFNKYQGLVLFLMLIAIWLK